MSPWVLKGLLLIADQQVELPKKAAPEATVRVQEAPKRVPGSKADCFPWFPERGYKCPDPRESQR
jgi:hypothetical protein